MDGQVTLSSPLPPVSCGGGEPALEVMHVKSCRSQPAIAAPSLRVDPRHRGLGCTLQAPGWGRGGGGGACWARSQGPRVLTHGGPRQLDSQHQSAFAASAPGSLASLPAPHEGSTPHFRGVLGEGKLQAAPAILGGEGAQEPFLA